MAYGLPPAWTTDKELESSEFQKWTDSIEWHHEALPHVFDMSGNLVSPTAGLVMLKGYIFVSPDVYSDYAGAGAPFGQFYIPFPGGLLSELLFVRCQPATDPSSNGPMVASVSGESVGGVRIFVYDAGGSTIGGFAIWLTAIGKLTPGKIP